MAHCRNDSLILRSIEEIRTVQRKRPHRENILAFASKHFGLNLSDGEDSLDSLMKEGVVFNKPTSTGLPSLFIKEDINNAEATAEIAEETLNPLWVSYGHGFKGLGLFNLCLTHSH